MKHILALLTFLFALTSASQAQVASGIDIDWKAQFSTAVSWTTFGVIDDSGATDNTAALNSIPGNTPILADCPHGGFVRYTGTWAWPDHLRVWQSPNCWLESTITTPGTYPISPTPIDSSIPANDIQYYNINFRLTVATRSVRMMLANINNFIMKYGHLDSTGGFTFLGGSNQEVAYIALTNTPEFPGSPGIRQIANEPIVPTTGGKHNNVWYHGNNFQAGDGRFQACQIVGLSSAIPITSWLYNHGTNGVTYEDNFSFGSASGAVILANLQVPLSPGDRHHCDNITFRRTSGGANAYALILPGGDNSETHNIKIIDSFYDGTGATTPLAAVAIGQVRRGPTFFNGRNMTLVNLTNITVNNAFLQQAEINGPFPLISFNNIQFNASQRIGTRGPAISIAGIPGFTWTGGGVDINTDNVFGAIAIGATPTDPLVHVLDTQSANQSFTNLNITGVDDGQYGFYAQNALATIITSNTVTAAPPVVNHTVTGAQGIIFQSDPLGAHNVIATGNNLTGVQFPFNCAPNQGNHTGVAPCP